jgi:hypothetical protein
VKNSLVFGFSLVEGGFLKRKGRGELREVV